MAGRGAPNRALQPTAANNQFKKQPAHPTPNRLPTAPSSSTATCSAVPGSIPAEPCLRGGEFDAGLRSLAIDSARSPNEFDDSAGAMENESAIVLMLKRS